MIRHTIFIYVLSSWWWEMFSLVTAITIPQYLILPKTTTLPSAKGMLVCQQLIDHKF